jgi:hypothetical protein
LPGVALPLAFLLGFLSFWFFFVAWLFMLTFAG